MCSQTGVWEQGTRIAHHNCEQSGALRICVPKLEFGNKEQELHIITVSKAELCGYVFPNWSLGTRNKNVRRCPL